MNNYKISIIVPVYNSEEYLQRCIKSILCQTYSNFELILINDGSTDNSHEICSKYASKDKRIIYIQQSNKGASYARNKGLVLAKGEYLCFVDSDDYIDKNMLKVFIENNQSKHDLVLCNFYSQDKYGNIHRCIPFKKYGTLNKEDIFEYLVKPIVGNTFDSYSDARPMFSIWRGMYHRKLIDKYNIRFKNLKIGEDFIFNLEVLIKCNDINLINDYLYYYYGNEDSQSSNQGSNLLDILEEGNNNIKLILDNNNLLNKEMNERLECNKLMSIVISIYNELRSKEKGKFIRITKIKNNQTYKQNFTYKFCLSQENIHKKLI